MLLLKTIAKNISQVIEGDSIQPKTVSSRRQDLIMGHNRKQGQRRSSDIGVQKSSLNGVGARLREQSAQDGKVIPWDDHDVRKIRDVLVVTDYVQGPAAGKRGRSTS